MIHDAIIFAALGPLVEDRCWPVMIPQEKGKPPVWPAIRYTPVGGTITPDACGGGTAATDDQRVQVDCIVEGDYKACGALCELARAAMEALAVPTVADGPPLYEYDAETQTFRAIQDFTIYGSSP